MELCGERYHLGMAMTTEELAARLSTEASRRGLSAEELLDELAAASPTPPVRTRFAFVGMGHSGRGDLAERHKEICDDLLAAQRNRRE